MAIEVVRTSDEFSEILWILAELGQRLPQLRDNPIYLTSIPHYLSSGAYKFITAGPRTTSGRLESQTAFGFVTFYRSPMHNKIVHNGIVLAVEAFWFKDDNLDRQLPVWSFLTSLSRKMGFYGVCIARSSINTPTSLEELLRRGELGGDPILPDSVGLQPDVEEIYSAFVDGPLSKKLFRPHVSIFCRKSSSALSRVLRMLEMQSFTVARVGERTNHTGIVEICRNSPPSSWNAVFQLEHLGASLEPYRIRSCNRVT